MTDKELIKALENKINGSDFQSYGDDDILDLIICQKAEIERLQKKVEELSEVLSDSIRIRYKEAKSEAVKEFANRLKEVSSEMVMMCDNGTPISISYSISSKKLDSILKEMVGNEK